MTATTDEEAQHAVATANQCAYTHTISSKGRPLLLFEGQKVRKRRERIRERIRLQKGYDRDDDGYGGC